MPNRLYPEEPIVGVGAVVSKVEEVLIIKRSKPPLKGEWSIPGGKLEKGESLIDGVKREIYEECGITIEINDLIDVFEYIERDEINKVKFHYIVFDFKADYVSGKLKSQSDALEARWVEADKLKNYRMKAETRKMIIKGLRI